MDKRLIIFIAALVLFSIFLFVWWYSSMQGIDMPSLISDQEQPAKAIISQTFSQSDKNFAVWPNMITLRRGYALKMSAGIKNDASDGQTHDFSINIIPSEVSQNICPNGDINSCGGKSMKEFMQSWIATAPKLSRIQINETEYISIIVKPSVNAALGTYLFNVVACKDMQYSNCTLENYNWGSPQQFAITITS